MGAGVGAWCGSQEGRVELRAGADLELAIGVAQVHLDRFDGDEERLRDLLVAHAVGGELGYAPLARGECVEPRLEDFSRSRAGGGDLLVRPPGEPECADPSRQVDALPEALACLGPLVRAAEGCAEVDEGVRVLEPSFRAREQLDRLPEQRDSCLAPSTRPSTRREAPMAYGSPQRRASASSSSASARASSFRSSSRRPSAAQLPPGHAAWIVERDEPNGLADLEQLLDSPLGASGLDAQMAAVEPKPGEVELVERELLREVTLVDDSRGFVRVALLQERMRQEPDVVRRGDEHAVRDAEIDRLAQIRDRCSKIAPMRLT